ncbi:hypothetical protein [Kitasatospora sp. LaBMicrA B282]|uniref:hypothetical protein n=1 Tax=Kitasatospora sp. LaBMicrA B282 TaxID=3420949 RepID=UPI003D0B6087
MRRSTAALATAAAALAGAVLFTGTARAQPLAGSHVRFSDPPVTFRQCEEGGGWVATDIASRREFCVGGRYNGRYVDWE